MAVFFDSVTLGFAAGGFCAVSCLPFYISFAISGKTGVRRFLHVAYIFAGRLAAYLLAGAAAGALGASVSRDFVTTASAYATLILCAALLLRAAGVLKERFALCSKLFHLTEKAPVPFLVGFLAGFNLCYPFAQAIVFAADSQSVLKGMEIFAGFFIGTSVFLLPIFALPAIPGERVRNWLMKFSTAVAAVLAFFMISRAANEIFPAEASRVEVTKEDVQKIFPDAKVVELVRTPHPYFVARGSEGVLGYAVLSTDWTDVKGYGGPIPVFIAFDNDSAIISLKVLPNDESPLYVRDVFSDKYLKRFYGLKRQDVDAVTGATISSNALKTTINETSYNLSSWIYLGKSPESVHLAGGIAGYTSSHDMFWFFANLLIWNLLIVYSAHVVHHPKFRTAFLLVVVVVSGIILNQYLSITDLVRISFFHEWDIESLRNQIILVVLIFTVLYGRIFCSLVCPYGALQEILYKVSPWKSRVSENLDRKLRLVKYFVLLAVPLLFAISRNFDILNFEPFNMTMQSIAHPSFFAGLLADYTVYVFYMLILLLAALFFERFFCNYLCPLGAMFAMISGVRILPRKWLFKKGYTCAGCAKGIPNSDGECFICGGVGKEEPTAQETAAENSNGKT
jgi:sulfite exporter TauE/SafE